MPRISACAAPLFISRLSFILDQGQKSGNVVITRSNVRFLRYQASAEPANPVAEPHDRARSYGLRDTASSPEARRTSGCSPPWRAAAAWVRLAARQAPTVPACPHRCPTRSKRRGRANYAPWAESPGTSRHWREPRPPRPRWARRRPRRLQCVQRALPEFDDRQIAGTESVPGAICDRPHGHPHREILIGNAVNAGEIAGLHRLAVLAVVVVAQQAIALVEIDATHIAQELAPRGRLWRGGRVSPCDEVEGGRRVIHGNVDVGNVVEIVRRNQHGIRRHEHSAAAIDMTCDAAWLMGRRMSA